MDRHDDTRTVQSGTNAHKYDGAVTMPIFTTSTFAFESSDAVEAYNRDPSGHYLYTRYANPTIVAVEQIVADLERAEASRLFASGMAAITSSVLAVVKSGDKIVTTPSLYGGTRKFFRDILPRYGIEVVFAPSNVIDAVEPLIDSKTKLLYLESPANPHVEVLDVKAFAVTAKERGIVSAVDATFATPILIKPYVLGIDWRSSQRQSEHDQEGGGVSPHTGWRNRSRRSFPSWPRTQDAGSQNGQALRQRHASGASFAEIGEGLRVVLPRSIKLPLA
jgi:cystathionine beta-lyase/cystathionine gamma-synthase